MNLPNKLTMIRIILIPIFIIFLLLRKQIPGAEVFSLAVFILAAITDSLDGYMARKHKMVTKFGKIVDPVADKLLISAALITFVSLNEISIWAAILIIGREFAVTGLRIIAAKDGVIISASIWGKIKTTIQITAVIAVIVDPKIITLPYYIPNILIWLAVIITIYSGYKYFKSIDIDFFVEEKG
ncbi:MAG: CDP-diacylglycerol--glycerol-3-phosphate 3-phosphatidyltransferase [Halanaerobiales bacterium]|nr:CDP-diacylglycerol--glycerol-3-phosphate 3-phosphatidyltransferase [Halanaerobiales bacterium]